MKISTKITIVSGVAGSGKSYYCDQRENTYDYVLRHDEWVQDFFDMADPFNNEFIFQLFMLFPKADTPADITKENITKWIFEDQALAVLYASAWKIKFCFMIAAFMKDYRKMNILIECPFLDNNIRALKNLYPDNFKIIWIKTSKDVVQRLKDRNWSDDRITYTISTQNSEYTEFKSIVDEEI